MMQPKEIMMKSVTKTRDAIVSLCETLVWIMRSLWGGLRWSWLEMRYWFRLFIYTSRLFLRVELLFAAIGALLFFSLIITQDMVRNQHTMLEHCYLFFTGIMVLFSMNLIPREREEETLEILWSQPINRNKMILLQLLTLTVWSLVLCLLVVLGFSQFMPYNEKHIYILPILVMTTVFTVGSITILVSTFCRQAIATGLVALLLLGVHYFWLRNLGPINLFFNPIPFPEEALQRGAGRFANKNTEGIMPLLISIAMNRFFVIVLTGFILDYLFRRLKRTAEWFT
jgi:hypothetical protein